MSQLLSPFTLGSLKLANRIAMAPLTRGRAGATRVANAYMAQYYEMRASAGLIISEATPVSAQGYGWFATPGLYTEEQAQGWRLSTEAVHAKGGAIFAQLWHMGRQSHPSFNDKHEIVAPSALQFVTQNTLKDAHGNRVNFPVPRALETHEMAGIVADYRRSAQLAKQAGFDGIEIHAANGYLLDMFLQSSTNLRTDGYGGSVDNRARLLLEVLEAVKTVFPADRIGVRVSPNGSYGGMGSEDNDKTFPLVAKMLSTHGLAYLHVLDGLGFGFHNKCRPVTVYDMKKQFEGNVMANVTLSKDTAEGMLRSGAADLVAFGRPFISNPDLVERFKNDWPLAPEAPHSHWWDGTADPKDSLEGYLSYKPYQPTA